MLPQVYECGDTLKFTWVSCVQPDGAPRLSITDSAGMIYTSMTAQSSSSLSYYTMVTMPQTPGWYLAEWMALKSIVGSSYNFPNRSAFRVDRTQLLTG